jgi:hypothetical protein
LLSEYLRRLASARSRCCFWLNDRRRQLYRSGFRHRPGDASAPHAIFLRFSLWRTRLNLFQPKDTACSDDAIVVDKAQLQGMNRED